MRRLITLLTGYLVLIAATQACWTEQNYLGMIGDAQKLMPANLQWVIQHYADDVYAGQMTQPTQRMNLQENVNAILTDSESAIRSFTTDHSYSGGSRLLGRIARRISDIHSLLTQPSRLNDANWITDYAIFLQKNRQYFRIRWRGLDSRPRSAEGLRQLLIRSAERRDQLTAILEETLNRENKRIADYDLLSAPFGTGTITYSSAVNTIALTWLYIWDRAGGISSSLDHREP
ncbi:hypothetical protein JW823_00405 [bacterium]|nr:hypothetical protein [candidate division CSSED10-310 bacterium]